MKIWFEKHKDTSTVTDGKSNELGAASQSLFYRKRWAAYSSLVNSPFQTYWK